MMFLLAACGSTGGTTDAGSATADASIDETETGTEAAEATYTIKQFFYTIKTDVYDQTRVYFVVEISNDTDQTFTDDLYYIACQASGYEDYFYAIPQVFVGESIFLCRSFPYYDDTEFTVDDFAIVSSEEFLGVAVVPDYQYSTSDFRVTETKDYSSEDPYVLAYVEYAPNGVVSTEELPRNGYGYVSVYGNFVFYKNGEIVFGIPSSLASNAEEGTGLHVCVFEDGRSISFEDLPEYDSFEVYVSSAAQKSDFE